MITPEKETTQCDAVKRDRHPEDGSPIFHYCVRQPHEEGTLHRCRCSKEWAR